MVGPSVIVHQQGCPAALLSPIVIESILPPVTYLRKAMGIFFSPEGGMSHCEYNSNRK